MTDATGYRPVTHDRRGSTRNYRRAVGAAKAGIRVKRSFSTVV